MPEPTNVEITKPSEMVEIPKSELATIQEKARKHDRDSGRARILEKREQAIKDNEARLAQERATAAQAELDAVKDNPEGLTAVQQKHEIRRLKAEAEAAKQRAEQAEAERDEARGNTAKSEQERTVREIAERLGVDAKPLLKVAGKLNADELEEIAQTLPKLSGDRTLITDSGRMRGSGKTFTRQQIKDMSSAEYAASKEAIENAMRAGNIR